MKKLLFLSLSLYHTPTQYQKWFPLLRKMFVDFLSLNSPLLHLATAWVSVLK